MPIVSFSQLVTSTTSLLPLSSGGNTSFSQLVASTTSLPSTFAQRVWCGPLVTWCYYVGALNPSPAPGDTTPNWFGSIERHQILGET